MRKILVYRGGKPEPAQVVVDLVGNYPTGLSRILVTRKGNDFIDIPMIGGRKSTKFLATCKVNNAVIGYGVFTGMPIASYVDGTYVLCGKPLNILLADLDELYSSALDLFNLDEESIIIEHVKKVIIGERMRHGRSATVHILDLFIRGEVGLRDLPSEIADLLISIPEDKRIRVVKRVLEELYA